MNIPELQKKILELKKEKDICILAHSYQSRDIVEVADFVGDSFQLSVKATTVPQKTVIMCGVRFMAETVKILSPEKKVIIPSPDAGCPMAEQMDVDYIESEKEKYPDATVVAYINTTAALKTICDVCVTSASAVKIVEALPNKDILFIPDCNLGSYVAQQVPDKNIILLQGGCPIHGTITAAEALRAKEAHPNAKLLVHPECKPEVQELADFIGSTSAIMSYAENSEENEFIIGTEISIAEHLSYSCPDKIFYPMTKSLICADMKLTTLPDLYRSMTGESGMEVIMDDDTITKAKACIDKMIDLG
ncbi:MAG: quinolinate synthase NadA [Lachnospiraceae bacterium]|nr:quinolinate synthase NadA [Lachnospiraceae bacterium]